MFGIMIEFAYFEGKEQSVYEEVFEFKTERAALDFFNHLLCGHVEYDFNGKGDRNGKHVECVATSEPHQQYVGWRVVRHDHCPDTQWQGFADRRHGFLPSFSHRRKVNGA